MLTFCPTYGLPTTGPQALPGPTFFAQPASSIPDLFETQQAQLRMISDAGVVSTHQVHCSLRVQDERSYPSLQKTEWVICPVSGQEMPLVRPLLIHDEFKKRVVLRVPEAFRNRVPLVMRWWFEYLSVTPRTIVPAYAMQPHIEFAPGPQVQQASREMLQAGPHIPSTPSLPAVSPAPSKPAPTSPSNARLPFPEAPSLGDLGAMAPSKRITPSSDAMTPQNASSSTLAALETSNKPPRTEPPASPSRAGIPAAPALPKITNTSLKPAMAPAPPSAIAAPAASTPSLSSLPGAPLGKLDPNKAAQEDELDEAPPTLMMPVSEEDQRKARAVLGVEVDDVQEVDAGDIEEVSILDDVESEPATQISRLSEEATNLLSSLQGDETNLDGLMGIGALPNVESQFDPKREQDRLSALLGLGEDTPITKDPSEAMTRPALRGVNPVAQTREDFIPDVPTVARPALSSLADMRQNKQRTATAIRTTVGEGISASAEVHPPKAAPADKKAWQQSGQSFWYSIDPAQQIASLHFLCPLSQSRILDRGGRAHFYLQLHRVRSYPLIMCLLAFEDAEGVLQHILACPVDLADTQAVMFFDLLSQEFTLQINLCNEQHLVYRDLQVYLPLEQNVEYVLEEARRWQSALPANQLDFDASIDEFQEENYDRLGKMSHNFQQDSFVEISSPAMARLAIGIVSYWSEREQFDYLISIKSFALTYFREIQKRVLRACIDFGIALRDHMLDLAIQFQFGSSRPDLLRKLLSNFAETNLQIRQPNDLSALDNLENWQHLIDDCDRYSIEIDSDIEELAAHAERLAQEQSQQEIDVEEVDDFEVFEDFQEMTPADLLQLLNNPQNRQEAATALCRPENVEYIDQVASFFPQLDEQEARDFAEAFTQFGKEAEPLLLSWLHLPRPDQRSAAILALGNMRSEHAIEAIIKRLRSGDEWEIAAEALARIGEAAIPLLEREVKNKNWLIRLRAVKALHKINTPEAHELLARLVNDPNEVVKSEVANILQGKH
ncbi:MAG: HEAT repeat domain-containing protein [Myxococcales bacterium]|nr:HEAT repeat domain-containing protein [Myxococcales bacterium]MCB9644315.1 HEAT repeat domain-containing protein [Myxococcales bacterium]